ncbi:MAG: hypothetical protein NZ953_01465 [Thaumarchaeota archaeon]|nr:hypothetical protein [Candidatus Calditenuaceae archaeon]MDW8043174.1 AN1-type zinc finger domain-containing protein [Nitrososphaerota archaeon]
MRCAVCDKEEVLPFKCAYCGQYHCAEHRLPEAHGCKYLHLARSPIEIERVESVVRERRPERVAMRLSGSEAANLAIGSALVTAVGFTLLRTGWTDLPHLALAVGAFTASFLVHELAHKYEAQRLGYSAVFKLSPIGALLTLLSVFSPLKVIAPGAVNVLGIPSARALARIAAVGPTSNIAIALVCYASSLVLQLASPASPLGRVVFVVGALNSFLALFNLLPFGPLDGLKVFSYSRRAWASLFVPSLLLTLYGYF